MDPGDANVVIRALKQKNWALAAILVTHHHHDHVGGLIELKNKFRIPVYGPLNESIKGIDFGLIENDVLDFSELGLSFRVLELPGHTLDHIAFINTHNAQTSLFCGDTLFSAGCGRMFEGSPEQFSNSLSKIMNLDHSTAIYCTHEYTASNLRFALHVEPDNSDMKQYVEYVEQQRKQNKPSIPSTLELEVKINPFLHCHIPEIQSRIAELSNISKQELLNKPVQTFAHMRQLKDNF